MGRNVITPEYQELLRSLHLADFNFGSNGDRRSDIVLYLSKTLNTTDVLDYGCGKGQLALKLPFTINEYDPGIIETSTVPGPADIVICTEVLEHAEPDLLNNVLEEIANCTKKVVYFVIDTRAATGTLPDGRNLHFTIQRKDWWVDRLKNYFVIEDSKEISAEVHIVARPLSINSVQVVGSNIIETDLKYVNTDSDTKWKILNLWNWDFTLMSYLTEQAENLDSIQLLDIGADIGVYDLFFANRHNFNVTAIESNFETFNVLSQNIQLNNLNSKVKSFCLTMSDTIRSASLGGINLTPVKNSTQTVTIDYLVKNKIIGLPTHIKISANGQEHKVVKGAESVLKVVKHLIVDVNENLPEHQTMINYIKGLGFTLDEDALRVAKRKKDWTFNGNTKYVFNR